MRKLIAILVLLLSVSCSQSASIRPSATEISGTYLYGDGIGFGEKLILNPDGTFQSTLMGHSVGDDPTFEGTWTLSGDRIDFVDNLKTPWHTYALTQTYRGVVVLVPGRSAGNSSVGEDWVYKKQTGR
jgi:hypothetical protein